MLSAHRGRRSFERATVTLAAVAVLVALALCAAATEAWPELERGYDALTASSQSPTQRELAPVESFSMSPELFERARATLPPDAVYSVVVGDTPETQELWHEAIPPLLRYWLLPRRYTPDVRAADWVITFHAPSELLGVPIAREIGLGPDGNAVEVRR